MINYIVSGIFCFAAVMAMIERRAELKKEEERDVTRFWLERLEEDDQESLKKLRDLGFYTETKWSERYQSGNITLKFQGQEILKMRTGLLMADFEWADWLKKEKELKKRYYEKIFELTEVLRKEQHEIEHKKFLKDQEEKANALKALRERVCLTGK